jgi:hypothetical protein
LHADESNGSTGNRLTRNRAFDERRIASTQVRCVSPDPFHVPSGACRGGAGRSGFSVSWDVSTEAAVARAIDREVGKPD